MWKKSADDEGRYANINLAESLSVAETPGGHPDDRFAVMAHLPSGSSIKLSSHRTRLEALAAVAEMIERLDAQ